jgi:uncharacterized protein
MTPLRVLAVLDGRLGHEKQTRGIIRALGDKTTVTVDYYSLPSLSLSSDIRAVLTYLKSVIKWKSSPTKRAEIDLLIGTGSHTHFPLLTMKNESGARAVTCMTPSVLLTPQMDLCVIPKHDHPRMAPNVFVTLGPPALLRSTGPHDPGRSLILVGGVDEKSHVWDTKNTLAQIESLLRKYPSSTWTLSSSPRTPQETSLQLQTLVKDHPTAHFFRSQDTPSGWIETQYDENLFVWVTADSISMVYEALSAGCRVGILPVQWKKKNNKFQRSIDDLVQNGWATTYPKWLSDGNIPKPTAPLDEASRCAHEILARWWPKRLE